MVFLGPAHHLGLLGDAGVNQLHLASSFSPLELHHIGQFFIEFCAVLNVFQDQEEGYSTARNGTLHQII